MSGREAVRRVTGSEAKSVATELRARQVVMVDDDYNQLADRTIADGVKPHDSNRRVPRPDKPQYVGLGSADQVSAKDVKSSTSAADAPRDGSCVEFRSTWLWLDTPRGRPQECGRCR
jgi:hypothetical protein